MCIPVNVTYSSGEYLVKNSFGKGSIIFSTFDRTLLHVRFYSAAPIIMKAKPCKIVMDGELLQEERAKLEEVIKENELMLIKIKQKIGE
ncbi:MAG: hypothetical protein AABW88_03300 [Nanoarchaeota archaeon]